MDRGGGGIQPVGLEWLVSSLVGAAEQCRSKWQERGMVRDVR